MIVQSCSNKEVF